MTCFSWFDGGPAARLRRRGRAAKASRAHPRPAPPPLAGVVALPIAVAAKACGLLGFVDGAKKRTESQGFEAAAPVEAAPLSTPPRRSRDVPSLTPPPVMQSANDEMSAAIEARRVEAAARKQRDQDDMTRWLAMQKARKEQEDREHEEHRRKVEQARKEMREAHEEKVRRKKLREDMVDTRQRQIKERDRDDIIEKAENKRQAKLLLEEEEVRLKKAEERLVEAKNAKGTMVGELKASDVYCGFRMTELKTMHKEKMATLFPSMNIMKAVSYDQWKRNSIDDVILPSTASSITVPWS